MNNSNTYAESLKGLIDDYLSDLMNKINMRRRISIS